MTSGGTVPCSGYHGYPCQYNTHVSAKKQKCRPCWRLEDLPVPDQLPPNPWAQLPQDPPQNEEIDDLNLEAVKVIARLLARYNEPGFQHIPFTGHAVYENEQHGHVYRTLVRMALLADDSIIPKLTLKRASHCGGVKPEPPYLIAFADTPKLADPGNQLMAHILDKLLSQCKGNVRSEQNLKIKNRIQFIKQLNNEHKADLLEANFAAADYAYKMQNDLQYTWATLEGGVHGVGELHTCNHYGEV